MTRTSGKQGGHSWSRKRLAAMAVSLAALALSGSAAGSPGAASMHEARARAIAAGRFGDALDLCGADSTRRIAVRIVEGGRQWLPPTRVFDNLFYVGNAFVGVWIVRTSAGLVLFDSLQSEGEARDHLVPDMRRLGLDPATIRVVIVTHGHWDHYGGARYLHETFGAKIAMSAADWTMLEGAAPGAIERAPSVGPDRRDRPPPKREMVIADGRKLVLGDTTLRLYVTPGHSRGTISAIIPVRENGHAWRLTLLGGTAFPPAREGNAHFGGLTAFDRSVRRLIALSRAAHSAGTLNTHIFADGSDARLAALATRQPGAPNPFIVGPDQVRDYYRVFDQCLLAASERSPAHAAQWDARPPGAIRVR